MREDLTGSEVTLTMLRAVLAGLLLSLAQPAAAWDDWGYGYGSYGYDWYDAEEAREDAQESAREAGREKRREEVEQKKAAASAEHAAYTEEIMAASQAAVQAPRGVYYRKPGFVSGEAPGSGAQVIEEAGIQVGDGSIITSQGTGRGWNHWHIRLNSSLGIPGWGMVPTHVCLMPNLLPSWFTWGYMCFIDAADVTNANTIVECGIGPFRSWPGIQAPHLLDAIERGAKLIVVDPRFEETACKAHIHLQLRPGTDAALALGLANVIINEGLYDKAFVEKWGLGFDKYKERVQEYPVDKVSEITWVPKEKIVGVVHPLLGLVGLACHPATSRVGLRPRRWLTRSQRHQRVRALRRSAHDPGAQ